MPSELEQTRTRFANSLVGCWRSASGSFSIVMDDSLRVNPDGTAVFTGFGCFGYAEGETHLEWRQTQPFEIELRVVREIPFDPDDELEEDEFDKPVRKQEDGSPRWVTFRYDFVEVTHDLGTEIGLIEVDADGQPVFGYTDRLGFYGSLAPMSYNEPIRTEEELHELRRANTPKPNNERNDSKIGNTILFSFVLPFVVVAFGCCVFLEQDQLAYSDKKGLFIVGLVLLLVWCLKLLHVDIPDTEKILLNGAQLATVASILLHTFLYNLSFLVSR